MKIPDVTIIGTGRLGQVLTKRLAEKEIAVKSVFNRTEKKARKLSGELNISLSGAFPTIKKELGHLIFFTVPDDLIEDAAEQLAQIDSDFSEFTFVHCSGNESATVLQPLREKGGVIASFHPLQSFTDKAGTSDFENIFFSMQGDRKAFRILMPLAHKIGAHAFEVSEEQKSQLHIAAVIASNYLVSLMNTSLEAASLGGLSEKQVQKALFPLIRQTLHNTSKQTIGEALTGPIARGDIKTLEKHLKYLDSRPRLQKIYALLGNETVNIARSAGSIDEDQAEEMRKMFAE